VELRFEQLVRAPRDALFAFHADPANLAELLAGWNGFELLAHEGHVRPGSRVQLSQRVALLRHAMTFEHFVLEPPLRFGERQVRGPFARFEHVHEFHEAAGGTTVVDRVGFELPVHLGGRVAERAVAAPVLRRFFEFRRAAYARLCAQGRFG
jgi:ligand-binding SRPBCC domain-containing protein